MYQNIDAQGWLIIRRGELRINSPLADNENRLLCLAQNHYLHLLKKSIILIVQKNKTTLLTSLIVLIIAIGCNSTSRLYRRNDKNKIYTGKLSDSTYQSLKQFLTASTKSKVNDTIIIKYDYNNEVCWEILDLKDDDYIMGFVITHQERVRKALAARENISIFDFREPGKNVNKIKKLDTSIKIDSTKFLFNLLFKKRCVCGSSIIVMPDKNYVFLRSDSHSDALDYSKEQINELLTKR